MKLRFLFVLCVPLLAQQQSQPQQQQPASGATPAAEPAVSGSVEIGYRYIPNIGGNFNVYRSAVDLGEGPKLLGLDLSLRPPSPTLFDRLDLHMSNWGDPYNTARLEAEKSNLYRLTVDYRDVAYFNFLPSFANPFPGSLLTNSAFDTRIRNTDVELDLFPAARFTPYLAYSQNSWYGRGIASFDADVVQFAVPQSVSDSTRTYRGGVQIQMRKFHAVLEEGGTTFKDDQGLSENQGNSGDLLTPFLGQPLSLSSLNSLYRVRGDSTFSRASVAWQPISWVTVSGQFLYSNPNTNTTYTSTAAGNLFSQDAFLFYDLGLDTATANAQMPRTTGSVTVDVRPIKRLRLVEYWSTDRLHNSSDLLFIEQLSLAGALVSGSSNPDADRLNLNYSRQEFDAYYDITPWLTIRGGEKYTWGDALVRGAAIMQTPFESGTLSQNAGIGGVAVRIRDKVRLNADIEGGSAAESYFRTSLHDYKKFRGRAEYTFLPGWKLSGDFYVLRNENPDPSVKLDFLSHAESAALSWTPQHAQNFDVLLDYTRSHINSDIYFIVPQTFQRAYSVYFEDANEATALVQLAPKAFGASALRPRLSFGGSLFTSAGSRPTKFYEPTVRLSIPLHKGIEWNTEWRWYGLAETFFQYEGFRSNQFTFSLRYFR